VALASQSGIDPAATLLPDSLTPNASAPGTGTRVRYFGDYELLEEIARGGMGVVWKARQTSLKRDVALKLIRDGALAGPDQVARFLREAEAAANLPHPNIVAIHEVGEHGGQHYFSMDYVEGCDLGALVKDGPLSPRRAAGYLKTIAEAAHFAHQRGTLHRDLKPQNVLIDASDRPRITDFGLAKFLNHDSRTTQSGVVMGSPSYMPPEQAAGRHGDIGPASDVYSLGAMLYELLTGRPPFRGSTPMATMIDVLEADPIAPRRLNADIPPDLETICLKCLEKSPSARYATARALAEELDRFLKGEPIHARPASAVRKLVTWTRRHPGTLAALAALVVASLAFGLLYLFEENAFLRAQQADPSLARAPGWRSQALAVWIGINSFAAVAGIYLFLVVRTRSQGRSVKEMFDTSSLLRPLQPLDEPTRIIALGGGVVLIGCGVILLATVIRAHVWEGYEISALRILLIYSLIYFGVATLGIVIRDYRLVHYGLPSSPSAQLTPEQIEPIRRALEDQNLWAAIKRYREAVPGTGRWAANREVIRLFQTLRTQDPDKYGPPIMSLATLNWKAVLIWALILALIFGAWWFSLPPPYPASAIPQFIYSLLFGMGLIASRRVKGFWTRLLLLTPALAVMILSETVVPRLTDTSAHFVELYVWGFFYGILLMLSAFHPRRRSD
jgi:hypothetical protein